MKIDKINFDGKKNSIEVLDKIFAGKINKKLVANILYKTNANYKGRKAKTKQKNEIIGSTSKIYAQKGTGNARHASKKAPIFVGGGVAHGPKGETRYKIRKLSISQKVCLPFLFFFPLKFEQKMLKDIVLQPSLSIFIKNIYYYIRKILYFFKIYLTNIIAYE